MDDTPCRFFVVPFISSPSASIHIAAGWHLLPSRPRQHRQRRTLCDNSRYFARGPGEWGTQCRRLASPLILYRLRTHVRQFEDLLTQRCRARVLAGQFLPFDFPPLFTGYKRVCCSAFTSRVSFLIHKLNVSTYSRCFAELIRHIVTDLTDPPFTTISRGSGCWHDGIGLERTPPKSLLSPYLITFFQSSLLSSPYAPHTIHTPFDTLPLKFSHVGYLLGAVLAILVFLMFYFSFLLKKNFSIVSPRNPQDSARPLSQIRTRFSRGRPVFNPSDGYVSPHLPSRPHRHR